MSHTGGKVHVLWAALNVPRAVPKKASATEVFQPLFKVVHLKQSGCIEGELGVFDQQGEDQRLPFLPEPPPKSPQPFLKLHAHCASNHPQK
jgi:hypothetical protein